MHDFFLGFARVENVEFRHVGQEDFDSSFDSYFGDWYEARFAVSWINTGRWKVPES